MSKTYPSFQLKGAKEEDLRSFLLQATSEGRLRPQVPEETFAFCKLLVDRPFSCVIDLGVGISSTPVWLSLLDEGGLVIGIDGNLRKYTKIVEPPQCIDTSKFVFLHGRSQDPAIIDRVRSYFDEGTVDLLFIDANHSYSGPPGIGGGVRADFDNYISFVRPGGLIGFHDIYMKVPNHDGPRRVFAELQEAGYRSQAIGGSDLGIGVIFVEEA